MRHLFRWELSKAEEADPELYDRLEKLVGEVYAVTAEMRELFFTLDRAGRCAVLADYGGNKYLLSEEVWQSLFGRVMEDKAMEPVITLFFVKLYDEDAKWQMCFCVTLSCTTTCGGGCSGKKQYKSNLGIIYRATVWLETIPRFV